MIEFEMPKLPPTPDPEPCPTHGVVPELHSECQQCLQDLREATRQYNADRETWRRWEGATVPPRLQGKTLQTWKPRTPADRQAMALLQGYVADLQTNVKTGRGVLLMGGPGLGKSHLLAALIGDAVEAGLEAGFIAWPELITRHREAQQGDRTHRDRTLLQTAMDMGVLALDEIGLAPMTEWQLAELFRLVDSRYSRLQPTLLAGNVNPATLGKAIGERTADRLLESCVCVPLTGASRRPDAPQRPEPPRFSEPQPVTMNVWLGHRWSERKIEAERFSHGRREL